MFYLKFTRITHPILALGQNPYFGQFFWGRLPFALLVYLYVQRNSKKKGLVELCSLFLLVFFDLCLNSIKGGGGLLSIYELERKREGGIGRRLYPGQLLSRGWVPGRRTESALPPHSGSCTCCSPAVTELSWSHNLISAPQKLCPAATAAAHFGEICIATANNCTAP